MANAAFIGLGVMGYPMAGYLKTKGGYDVTVYNRTTAKAEKWVVEYGGKSAPTPGDAASGATVATTVTPPWTSSPGARAMRDS